MKRTRRYSLVASFILVAQLGLGLIALAVSGLLYAGDAGADRAVDLYNRTEYHAAIALLQHANHDAQNLQLLGQCYFMDGQFAKATEGLYHFTWDELSPLLGVDPQIMYNTIREVGPEHFTLSSDAGEPLFPDSVEAMRLVRGYMEAFGLNQDELYTVCTRNPAKVVGLALQ